MLRSSKGCHSASKGTTVVAYERGKRGLASSFRLSGLRPSARAVVLVVPSPTQIDALCGGLAVVRGGRNIPCNPSLKGKAVGKLNPHCHTNPRT